MQNILADIRAIKNPYIRLLFLCMALTISYLVVRVETSNRAELTISKERIETWRGNYYKSQIEKDVLVRLLIQHDSANAEDKIKMMRNFNELQERRINRQDSLLHLPNKTK